MTIWPGSIDLCGADWRFGQAPATPLWQDDDLERVAAWLTANVPGQVESDLLANGRIADPFIAMNNEDNRWVQESDWWYRRLVNLALDSQQRAHLVLHGVDYNSSVHANGQRLGQHEGMFSEQVYELTALAAQSGGRVDLAIRLWGAHALPARRLGWPQRAAEPLLRRLAGAIDMFPSRVRTLKCQMSFGWDFAPRLPTCGIWDEAEVVVSGPVFIANVWVQATPHEHAASIVVRLDLDCTVEGPAIVQCDISGVNAGHEAASQAFDINLAQGRQEQRLAFDLPGAQLWQPWDRGEPFLYNLAVTIYPPAGPPSRAAATFGVRSVEMDGWTIAINGQREFVRGLNWVPADALYGRVRSTDYAALLALARDANANMLRVWGGGLREKRAFYDTCDRAGILVWQEMPLACPNLNNYPKDPWFLALAQQEATAIVRALRNHPSLVLWCGGNEFSPARNRPVVDRLQAAVSTHDGTRPWRPVSPSPGDSHNWQVWHHGAPLHSYRRETAAFVTEFGLQAPPDAASLHKFLPPADVWPPGPAWIYHNAEITKLDYYSARAASGRSENYLLATQSAQALGIQFMVEHMRRRKGQTGGVMVWQFNEPWPSICWSLVAFDRSLKPAYSMLQRVFHPILISLDYVVKPYAPGDIVEVQIWLINDARESLGDCRVTLCVNTQEVHRQDIEVGPDCSVRAATARLSAPPPESAWLLSAQLWRDEVVISENTYDLRYHDERTVPARHRLLSLLGRWLLH